MNLIDTSLSDYNVHVYRYADLVYVATFKCASTYYTTLFQSNGWQRIYWSDIDWKNDHVFGFLIDPVTRYVKALAEDYINEENEQFSEFILRYLENMLPRSSLITFHSIPICLGLKSYAKHIDWIPIADGYHHHSLLLNLLDSHNVNLSHHGDMVDSHIGTEYKKNLENRMLDLFNRSKKHVSYNLLLSEDIELFEQVKNSINPSGIHWDQISWLRSYNE